ncbi:DUF6368 family protein [Kitasatospora sp. NPDC088346]|uniref:DUF6368 family protein n=1 Tax=Kitasatospora sp. NPDC088346 TaxID=3364073 RepID=UPI00382E240D
MSGPGVSIELAGRIPGETEERLRELLVELSDHFTQERPDSYFMGVVPQRLGIATADDPDHSRPFCVSFGGPGYAYEDVFAGDHDYPDLDLGGLIGFTPAYDLHVIGTCNRQVDHVTAAMLTASVMDIVGGVVNIEVSERQLPAVRALPGFLGHADGWGRVFGSQEMLRSWALHPGFRLG